MVSKKKNKSDTVKVSSDDTACVTEEKDHNAFLEAFEKPSQIYRYLRMRHVHCPLFLNRTLYFMKHRCRRREIYKQLRRKFDINSLLAHVEKKALNCVSHFGYKQETLNITYCSFDTQGDIKSGTEATVEAFLVKCSHGKLQGTLSETDRTSLGNVSIPINAPCPLKTPHVMISPEHFTQPPNGTRYSYRLFFQVTQGGRPLENGQIPNGVPDNEPIAKRRRSTRCYPEEDIKPPPIIIYCSELTIYDSHQKCDLLEGKYDVALLNPDDTSWQATKNWLRNVDIEKEPNIMSTFNSAPKLKFDLRWIKSKPDSDVQSQNVIHIRDIGIRQLLPSPKPSDLRVFYDLLYKNEVKQRTEASPNTVCPWCLLQCGRFYPLLKHLRLSHTRFTFVYTPHSKVAEISVSVNEHFDGSYVGNPQDLHSHIGYASSRNAPVRRTPVTHVIVYRPRRGVPSFSEFVEGGHENVVTKEIVQGHNRMYYHTGTNQPIKPQEIDYDSEAENDPQWLRSKTVQMIDEFTDVNEGEKHIMKLWNLHVMKNTLVADCQVPQTCESFVHLHRNEIIEKNLQRNFLLHLVNLFDYNLIRVDTLQKAIALVIPNVMDLQE